MDKLTVQGELSQTILFWVNYGLWTPGTERLMFSSLVRVGRTFHSIGRGKLLHYVALVLTF